MNRRLPVVLVGAGGRGAGVYGPMLRGPLAERFRLVGVLSRGEGSARRAGESLDLPWGRFDELDELATRWGAAAAVVCPSSDQNAACLRRTALDLGLPTLVETPTALTAAEAAPLVAALEERGALVEVAEQNPRGPWCSVVRELAASGRLGRVRLVACDLASWRYHATAMARALLGRPRGAWAVGARTRFSGLTDGAGRPAWLVAGQAVGGDGAILHLRDGEAVFAPGSPWSIGTWSVYGDRGSVLGDRVLGSSGEEAVRLERDRAGRAVAARVSGPLGAGLSGWTAALPGAELDQDGQAIARCLLDWLERIEGGAPDSSWSPADALEDQRWIEGIERSALLGGARVGLAELPESAAGA